MADPWKNRNKGMQCRTCIFYIPKYAPDNPEKPNLENQIGRCRRRAPTMNGYPVVFTNDWCGDHKLDENKI